MLRHFALLLILFSGFASAQVVDMPFNVTPVATFNEPWAMTFMPDGYGGKHGGGFTACRGCHPVQ